MRRSSYASVLSGNPGASSSNNRRSGFLSQQGDPGASSLAQSFPSTRHHHHERNTLHSKSESHVDLAGRRWSRSISNMADSHGGDTFDDWPEFFIPSYLQNSRHMERLQEQYRTRSAAQKEGKANRLSMGSLSRSTSGANLHAKMVPSHRGMTHEIIERPFRPQPAEETVADIPTSLIGGTKALGIEVAYDGSEAKYNGLGKDRPSDEASSVRADRPMPRELGIYYYEVTVLSKGRDSPIAVGFSLEPVNLQRMPGWEPESWAYHGDDGHSFCQTATGKSYGAKFGTSDVIGCGVNFRTGIAFFTKNGSYIGPAFREIKQEGLMPTIGFKRANDHVRVNFGQDPFVYDIDGYVENERNLVRQEIAKEDIQHLHDSKQERRLEQELIAQYLAHDGYIEAAKAFAAEVQKDQRLLKGESDPSWSFEYREDPDAVHRQKIRSAILEGDMDTALNLTNKHFPTVLTGNENIYFKLRCRKFNEMIRRCTELQPASKSKRRPVRKAVNNGHDTTQPHDLSNGGMDIDDEAAVDDDDEEGEDEDEEDGIMQTEQASDVFAEHNTLMNEALKYGQELQSEFRDDPRKEIKQALENTFALIAYPDATQSNLAHLLEPEGRVPVAEELNGAILVSLGKSPNAALEHLYQQTEVLINDLSNSKGGDAASLINVRKDYLQ